MNLLGEDYTSLPNEDDVVNAFYWEYDIKNKDFFLSSSPTWKKVSSPAYKVTVGKHSTYIPTDYHVMIGDITGELDWTTVDEMIAREFEVFCFTTNLQEWQILPIEVSDYVSEYTYRVPNNTSPIPITVGDRAILVSERDLYHRTKEFIFNDIIGESHG